MSGAEMSENAIKQSGTSRKEKKKFPTRPTRTEIVLAIALIGTVSYFIYYKISTTEVQTEKNISCEDTLCFESSLEIKDFIDPSVDPCEDFYQFVCGNFIKNAFAKHVTRPTFLEEERLEFELTSTIMEPVSEGDSQQVTLQKTFFRSCIDLDAIDADEDETFFNLIEEIGGWPVLKGQSWLETEFDWMRVMIKSKQLGLPYEWFLSFELHLENGENILDIKYPYLSNHTNQNYRNFMMNMIFALSGSQSAANSETDGILQFERDLVNITRRHETEVSIHTIEQLQEWFPKYTWIELFSNMTDGNYEFTNDTEIATNIQSYITDLDNLLIKTPRRVQANYIVWKTFEYFAPYLSSQIRNAYFKVKRMEDLTRIQFCLGSTGNLFPYVAETEYIRKYSNPKTRKSAKKIANSVQEEFIIRIGNINWMRKETNKKYLDQLKSRSINAGGQDATFDDDFFDKNFLHIGDLDFSRDNVNIIEMISERKRCYSESLFSAIGNPGLDKAKIQTQFVLGINVYLDRTQNTLSIPASALHGFLFDKDRPKCLNYGSLGGLLGEELVEHLIDQLKEDDGVKDIWTHRDYKVFANGTKCFEDDFSNNFEDEKSLNASELIQEVISDIIGRDLAYTAYQKWRRNNKEDTNLLLPYTPNQLFWIKSSLINCHKQLIDEEEEESEYVIPKFKNILSLRHSAHFADDFNCRLGTPMNPKRKCWSFL